MALWILLASILIVGAWSQETPQAEAPATDEAENRLSENWRLRDRMAENQWRLEHKQNHWHPGEEDPHIRELVRPKGHELLREHEREREYLEQHDYHDDDHQDHHHEEPHGRPPMEIPPHLPPLKTAKHHPSPKEKSVIAEVLNPLYRQPTKLVDYRFLSSGGRDYTFSEMGQTLILPRGRKNPEPQEFENYDIYIEYLRLKGIADQKTHEHEPGKVRIERYGFEAVPKYSIHEPWVNRKPWHH